MLGVDAEQREGLWFIAGFVVVIGGALAIALSFIPDDTDHAERNVQAVLNTVAAGEAFGVYNGFHPTVQERVSLERWRQIMKQHHKAFGRAEIKDAKQLGDTDSFEVRAEYLATGKAHVMLVRQRMWNGMRRITDGQIESLTTDYNALLLTDIVLDGKSILTAE
jgi:hypothetical protein